MARRGPNTPRGLDTVDSGFRTPSVSSSLMSSSLASVTASSSSASSSNSSSVAGASSVTYSYQSCLADRTRITPLLSPRMATRELLDRLASKGILSSSEVERILSRRKHSKRANSLLDLIKEKAADQIEQFFQCLSAELPDLARALSDYKSVAESSTSSSDNVTQELRESLDKKNTSIPVFYRILKKCSPGDVRRLRLEGMTLLHYLVLHGLVSCIKCVQYAGLWGDLHQERSDSDCRQFPRTTAVQYAQNLNKDSMVRLLASITKEEAKLSALAKYTRGADLEQFRTWKRQSLRDIRSQLTQGVNLLLLACQSGDLAMVREVISLEQELQYRRQAVTDEVILCVELGHGHLLGALLEYKPLAINSVRQSGQGLVEIAVVNGDSRTFHTLRQLGAAVPEMIVALAAARKRLPFLQDLFAGDRHYSAFVNVKDRRKKTAGHFAADKGFSSVLSFLLSKGLDPCMCDLRGHTILHSAVSGGEAETVRVVLSYAREHGGLDALLTARDRYLGAEQCFTVRGVNGGRPAWHMVEIDRALTYGFRHRPEGPSTLDVVDYGRILASGVGANDPSPEEKRDVENSYDMLRMPADAPADMQAVHIALVKNLSQVAAMIIEEMTWVNQPDRFGLVPLHLAAMNGDIQVLQMLLNKGANKAAVDDKGRTPLDVARANHHGDDVCDLLKETETSPTEELRRNLIRVAEHLSPSYIQQKEAEGEPADQFIKLLLRELCADVHDYLYDHLHIGPVAQEGATP